MNWSISFTKKAAKQLQAANKRVQFTMRLLVEDLRLNGPVPGPRWFNYSKLKGQKRNLHHCHLMKGKPTYVCCWDVSDKQARLIEVYYVGTHEKAPY